jgi:hypothetical protein
METPKEKERAKKGGKRNKLNKTIKISQDLQSKKKG